MSIITFWSNGHEQTGKTLSIAAIATYLAIEHNKKILIVSTGYRDKTLDNCYWKEKKAKKSLGIFGPNTNASLADGITGLVKVINSNKLTPESITNYTKIIFKDRLEILQSFKGELSDYESLKNNYADIINFANSYYDLVFVDLDRELEDEISKTILENSNLIVANLNQRLSCIDDFVSLRNNDNLFSSEKTMILIGKYDKDSKYTAKNITRYMGLKNKVSVMPYNTLFFEAAEEARVPDLFLRIRNIKDQDDINNYFLNEIKGTVENILFRLEMYR